MASELRTKDMVAFWRDVIALVGGSNGWDANTQHCLQVSQGRIRFRLAGTCTLGVCFFTLDHIRWVFYSFYKFGIDFTRVSNNHSLRLQSQTRRP